MTYSLKFHEKALKEWQKLGEPIRNQLKKEIDGTVGESTCSSG